jgi:hypothetical protein
MKILTACFLALVIAALSSGCASYMVMDGSRQDLRAVRAAELSGGGAGVGIDISTMQALGHRPWLQAGAAVLDAASLYGLCLAAEELEGGGDDDDAAVRIQAGGDVIYNADTASPAVNNRTNQEH